MARSSRARTRFSSGCPPALCSAASLATTTLDLPAWARWSCESSIPASPNLLCAPRRTAPVVAPFINSRRFFIAILTFVIGSVLRPSDLEFRFHAVRQCKQSLLGFGLGLVGNDAHQAGTLAEDDALRVRDARVAQLNTLGILALSGFEDLASAIRAAHWMHIDNRLQLALVCVVGGRSGDHAGGDVLLGVAVDVLVQVLGRKGARIAGIFPAGDGAGCWECVDIVLLAS